MDNWIKKTRKERRSDLRRAQWDEDALMVLANSVSDVDMRTLSRIFWDYDEPRIPRIRRVDVIGMLMDWQASLDGSGRFDCAICGHSFMRDDASLEHIIPRANIEISSLDNHCLTCVSCNGGRGANYTLTGYRNLLMARSHIVVNRERALLALDRVRRMTLLIARLEIWMRRSGVDVQR